MAILMKRAGCAGVEFGSDAVTERTLRGLGKQFTADEIARAAEACGKTDLPNAHYVIIGGPGENESTLEAAFSFFDRVHPTAVIALAGIRIYPGTALHRSSIDDGIVDKNEDLLKPVFYLSPELETERMFARISEAASQRSNWIVPGLNIRCDIESMLFLRRMNKRGPLWTELR